MRFPSRREAASGGVPKACRSSSGCEAGHTSSCRASERCGSSPASGAEATMTQRGPATDWHEDIRSDEASRFAGYARDIEDLQRWHAARTGGTIRRGFHTKPHAGLRGVFTVRSDVPDYARHGIFRTPVSRPAWVRFSSGFSRPQPDLFPDVRGLAVKIVGV